MFARLTLAATALILGAAVGQPRAQPTGIQVHEAWSRATGPGSPTGVGYLTIVNNGPRSDRLIGAATPVAASASLHRSVMRGGVMSMRSLPEGLAIPAGATVKLEPGGYHLMLTGLKRPLKVGARFPAVLTFDRAGKVGATFDVRAAPPDMPGMR